MKFLLSICFSISLLIAFGQTPPDKYPTLKYLVDKSPEGEKEFIREQQKCEAVWAKVKSREDYNKLSKTDKDIYDNCDETTLSYWDVFSGGCSWYCGGGMDTLSASSELKPSANHDYSAKNIHDLNYETAWVEGAPGDGIGESITYHFPPQNPRITEIIVVNGYVKSPKAWKENSRVKTLRMHVNGEPFALLHLADSKQEQHFTFEPLGYGERDNYEELQNKPWWTITFEIQEVYKGDKYSDTAITEIYFDGIDVH